MSHIVTIKTQVKDLAAVRAACQRLQLAPPRQGTAELFSGQATGLIVQLPDWTYPLVIDMESGDVRYDNFEGSWGSTEALDLFLKMYAAEKVKIEAHKRGYSVSEQTLQDGSIRLTLNEGV